ncbi:MAG: hypothetical protein OXE47_06685 [Gammaproteobacteria bacterium]|nr:hypothetical protein [Gammaproteobacteria bacterium]
MPKLIFPPGAPEGFPSSYLEGAKGNDFAPIRELLQNGLDAAVARGRDKAVIRFTVKKLNLQEIPAIDDYRAAFDLAMQDQKRLFKGRLPDSAKNIVDPIKKCLAGSKCDALFVSDNGIGLNEETMRALLGSGLGNKGTQSMGSFGLGHLSAFSASDLNYVLYGGTSESGNICSGHASLANSKDRGKHGYYVVKWRNDLFNPYDFPQGKQIPHVISDELDSIQKRWESGSVVIILGFNYFLRSLEELKNSIFKIAALNFFVAIYKKQLVVEFADNDNTLELNHDLLPEVLEEHKNEARRSANRFITGIRAYDAYQSLARGKPVNIKTEMGDVDIMYRAQVDGGRPPRVELCRGGMHITDSIPNFNNKFNDLQPFHCLITAGGKSAFSRAVRRAEDHTHSILKAKWISDANDRKKFNASLQAIVKWLQTNTPSINSDFHEIDDVFVVDSSGIGKGGHGVGLRGSFTKMKPTATSVPSQSEQDDNGKSPGAIKGDARRKGDHSTFTRSGNLLPLKALVAPMSPKRLSVAIARDSLEKNGEIRFVVDKHIDSGDYSYVVIKDVFVNNQPVPNTALSKDKRGNAHGVLLGKIPQIQGVGASFSMEVVYDLPSKYTEFDQDGDFLVFRAEMARRKIKP